MRSHAFFTNSVTANTTPPVDLLDIPSRTERPRSMRCQPRSGRVQPRSFQSRRDLPCSDAQRRARNHFLPCPRLLSPQSRQAPSSKRDHRSSTSRRDPRVRNQALGSRQPRLPTAPTRNLLELPAHELPSPHPLRSTTLQSSRARTSLRIQHPVAPSGSQPSRPLQRNQAASQDLSSTYQRSKPVNHHLPPRASTSFPRREGLFSVPVSRRLRPTLRSSTPFLFTAPISSPILLFLQPISTHRKAFPVGITTDVKLRARQSQLNFSTRNDRCLGRSQQGSDA